MATGCVEQDISTDTCDTSTSVPAYNSFTMCAWVKPTDNNADQYALSLGGASGGQRLSLIYACAGTTARFQVYNSNTGIDNLTVITTGTSPAPADNWYFVVMTGDSSNLTGYVYNSSFAAMTGSGGTIANTVSFTPNRARIAGDAKFNVNPFIGRHAMGRLWNVVLTQGEFEAEMVATSAVKTSGLVRNGTYGTDPTGNGWTVSGLTAITDDGPPIGASGAIAAMAAAYYYNS